jgi:hypothetical protein
MLSAPQSLQSITKICQRSKIGKLLPDALYVHTSAIASLETEGKPLHYRDITQKALAQGLIQTDGKTPEATLNGWRTAD